MLITLFESETPYSYDNLNNALFNKLTELGENCEQEFGIIQQWRYGNELYQSCMHELLISKAKPIVLWFSIF